MTRPLRMMPVPVPTELPSEERPVLEAVWRKWYSRYLGKKVPIPENARSATTAEQRFHMYTLFRNSLLVHCLVSSINSLPVFSLFITSFSWKSEKNETHHKRFVDTVYVDIHIEMEVDNR